VLRPFIQKPLIILISVSLFLPSLTAFAATANDPSAYKPYEGQFDYGANLGYYGAQFKDEDVAKLAALAGFRTIRPSLADWLITGYGADARLAAFQAYQAMGMHDLTVFVGEPNNPKVNGTPGPDDRETKIFPGADERAKTFTGLYEPVWLDAANTEINPANTYANYLYKTVKEYGPYVKVWEIVNEPDFTYSAAAWEDASAPDSWWNVNPNPNDLANLKAPVYYYIRELHVAYDVIKTLEPNEYVATGGIGYASFLDALMRNTDNPVDGSMTVEYPEKGGAYFDILSFHSYPMYDLRTWDNASGGFIYKRQSDAAVDAFLSEKNSLANVLLKYGYGSKYPGKQWIVTETDMPESASGSDWGSQALADNYIMKAEIMAQASGIAQVYKYGLGENANGTDAFNSMGVYGDLTNATLANAPKTDEYKAVATLSKVLYGKTYDAAKTAALRLPPTVRGAAFRDPSTGQYTYALWARTSGDKSENASANYTFPFPFSGTRRQWDYSATAAAVNASQTVALSGSPSFFTDSAAGAKTAQATAGKIKVTVASLNVRSSANGARIGRVGYGASGTLGAQVFRSGVAWNKVVFDNGVAGWVASKYLVLV